MELTRVWPPWREAWVLYEDPWLIAVNKPAGISSQAVDAEDTSDVPTRLRQWLAARDGVEASEVYLGVHQRLDRETSGVLLYAKHPDANAGLAKQFEEREVDKRYLARVAARVETSRGEYRLHDRLAKRGGRAVRSSTGKEASCRVQVLESEGETSLLEVRLETGRTHQIRAQLSLRGWPILGDAIYEGSAAPRLMLHACRLALRHPTKDAPLVIEAPAPPGLGPGVDGADLPLRSRLEHALERRYRLSQDADTTCFRLVHGEGDALEGLAVDRYADWLVVHDYGVLDAARLEEALDTLEGLGFAGIYLKRRPRQANVIVDASDEAYAPSDPVRGRAAPEPLVVHEHGLPLIVRLAEGLSTGVFLDQRENRAWVMKNAGGKRVLNLFAYTGGFTVAAAAGGARETLTVDSSARLLAWARDNLHGAGFDGGAHAFWKDDAFATLAKLARRGERFDLVVVDPPTYSRTKTTRWSSGKGWRGLAAACLRVLEPGGTLLACSNDGRLAERALRRFIHEGAREAGVPLAGMRSRAPSIDHPAPCGGEPLMKALLVERANQGAGSASSSVGGMGTGKGGQ